MEDRVNWRNVNLDPSEARPVELRKVVETGMIGEYVVEPDRTKVHLFRGGSGEPTKWGPVIRSLVESTAKELFGADVEVDWVPEVESWWVGVPRPVPDGEFAVRSLIRGIAEHAARSS